MKNYKEEFEKEQQSLITDLVNKYWLKLNSLDLSLQEWLEYYKNIDFSWVNKDLQKKVDEKIITLSPYKVRDVVRRTRSINYKGNTSWSEPGIFPLYRIKEISIKYHKNSSTYRLHYGLAFAEKDIILGERWYGLEDLLDVDTQFAKITWSKL